MPRLSFARIANKHRNLLTLRQERFRDNLSRITGSIFSRDGFVRFVRLDKNLEIEIYGEGVEHYAPNVYRLKNVD